MTKVEIKCDQCGGDQYRIIDKTVGEVMCEFCHNRWIIPNLKDDPRLAEQESRIKILTSRLSDKHREEVEVAKATRDKENKTAVSRIFGVIVGILGVIVSILAMIIVLNILMG